jgi:hypothetical protein
LPAFVAFTCFWSISRLAFSDHAWVMIGVSPTIHVLKPENLVFFDN